MIFKKYVRKEKKIRILKKATERIYKPEEAKINLERPIQKEVEKGVEV